MSADEEEADDAPDDQPAIDDDEMADFSEVAASIEESSSEDVDEDVQDDVDDDRDQEDGADRDEDVLEGGAGEMDVSIGTVYCNGLGMSAAVVRAHYGSADEDDREDLVEEYSSMAEQLQIDDYVDEWMEQQGGIDQLSPGQAILISTMLWGSMVVMDDPTILENLGGEVSS